jgi:DNA processing protein
MACTVCQRRAALIAALAPAISRLSFTRQGLLELLALTNKQLLGVVKVKDPDGLLRGLEPPLLSESVPTAVCRHNSDYPEALRQLPSAPAVLYATCTTQRLRELLSKPTVAIAGSSEHTPYAERIASELARDLASAGVTVISGMNKGLEGIVQHSALNAGGNTIAVMSGCPEIPFPSQHKSLHRGILARGAAVSELPPGCFPPQGWCFISSQRILAALAPIVVVVEAGKYSCALLTAQIAADLGADVAIVPGRVTDPGGRWTCALLRDGAHPVACAQDVLDLISGDEVRANAA